MQGFPGGSAGKEFAYKAGDVGLIPGSGRSPGGGHDNPLRYSCLENPMDRGALQATVHSVSKNRTCLKCLSTHAHVTCICLISTVAPGKCCKTVRTRWKTLDLKSEDLDFTPYKITRSWFLPLSKGLYLPHRIVIKIKWDNAHGKML